MIWLLSVPAVLLLYRLLAQVAGRECGRRG